jgi:FkbM family methyltransferase
MKFFPLKVCLRALQKKTISPSTAGSAVQEVSPLKNGQHAETDPFFNTLLRLGYHPGHIVDVGANRGNWTRTALKYFPYSRFTMFEPQEKMREEVSDLLAHPGIEFHCMGAGPVNSSMRLTQHERDDSHTFALSPRQAQELGYQQIEVPVVALDDFFEGRGLPKIDILKIDAEGWDLEVLKGARKIVDEADIVLMEASVLNPIFTNTVEDVISAMSRLGFVLFDITDLNRTAKDGALWLVELAFVKRNGDLKKAIHSYA